MKTVLSENAPKPVGPYSQAVKANGFLFISGQLGMDKNGNVKETIEGQTEQALENIKAILSKENLDLDNVVKVTIFLNDMENFGKMNSVYEKYLKAPARACFGVNLIKNFKIEIEATASYE
ncbi:MAG: RidA family protein [Methanomicrobia archaeon]|nr:RidA family protein [Methanomicrobia archaeon]